MVWETLWASNRDNRVCSGECYCCDHQRLKEPPVKTQTENIQVPVLLFYSFQGFNLAEIESQACAK